MHVSLSFSHVHACVHPGTRRCRCGDEGVGQCHSLFGTDARGDNGALVPCVERRACMCPEPDQDVWLKTLAHLVVSLISPRDGAVATDDETSPLRTVGARHLCLYWCRGSPGMLRGESFFHHLGSGWGCGCAAGCWGHRQELQVLRVLFRCENFRTCRPLSRRMAGCCLSRRAFIAEWVRLRCQYKLSCQHLEH